MIKLYQNEIRAAFGNWDGMIKSPPLVFTDNPTAKQLFFRFDSSYASDEKECVKRIIGWAHPMMMDLLKESRFNIFIDATFRCVPREFDQLLILMVYSKPRKYYFPCFYVLMQEKTQQAYELVFQRILEALKMNKMDVATLTCDFEKAMVNASKKKHSVLQILNMFYVFFTLNRRFEESSLIFICLKT